MKDYYTRFKIQEKLSGLFTTTGEILYWLQGKEDDFLIDAGLGLSDPKVYLEQLTDHPVTLLLSHGHMDHLLGAKNFNDIYLHPNDQRLYLTGGMEATRDVYLNRYLKRARTLPDKSYWLAETKLITKPLADGDCFDTGYERITCLELPGHTAGSMMFLLEKSRILIAGDALSPIVYLFFDESANVSVYRDGLIRVQKELAGRFDVIHFSHTKKTAGPDLFDRMTALCDKLLLGKIESEDFPFVDGNTYQRVQENGVELIYREDKLTE